MKLKRKLYSEKKEKVRKSAIKAGAALGGLKIANAVGQVALSYKTRNLAKDAKEHYNTPSGKKITDKLKNSIAEHKDVELLKTKYGDGFIDKDILKRVKNSSIKSNKNVISLENINNPNSTTLAHEYGHYMNNKGKSVPAKIAEIVLRSKSGALTSVSGLGSGIMIANRESEGKDAGGYKYGGAAAGLVTNIPTLIEEGRASGKAINMLKKAGANKRQLKSSKKALGSAFGTYALSTSSNMISGTASQKLGKTIGRVYYKNKNKKNNETEA